MAEGNAFLDIRICTLLNCPEYIRTWCIHASRCVRVCIQFMWVDMHKRGAEDAQAFTHITVSGQTYYMYGAKVARKH